MISGIRRIGVLFFLAVSAASCDQPRSTCAVAQRRLEDCDAEIRAAAEQQGYVGLPLQLTSCSGASNQCLAECIADSSCPAITFVLLGKGLHSDPGLRTPPGAGPFTLCLQTCVKLAE